MAMQPTLKKMRNLAFIGCFILGASACSGSDDEEIEEAIQNEETPDELASEGSEGVEETAAAEEAAAAEAEAAAAREAAEAAAAAEQEAAAQASAEQEDAASAATEAAASAPAADPSQNKGKRVWYVRTHHLPAYASPDGKGAPVRTFSRGDHILAKVQGAWAEISSGVWVRSRDLSRTPVGRHKSRANWSRRR